MDIEEIKKLYPPFTGKVANNFIDLTGKKFGKLTVLYRYEKNIRGGAAWVCQCSCENKTICIKQGGDLRTGRITGCGCTLHEKREIEIPTETKFGYWKVLKRVENDSYNRICYLCLCTACGEQKIVPKARLVSERSTNCGCIRMKKMQMSNIIDETGKTYGFLQVQRQATEEEKQIKLLNSNTKKGTYWNCTCLNCGKKNVIVLGSHLRNKSTISCGCIHSKNEVIIQQILDQNGYYYKTQYKFDNLRVGKSNTRLIFDIGVFDSKEYKKLKYLIEYDGEQHFKTGSGLFNSPENVKRIHTNDLLKNRYCFDNNIPIIRIPYNAKYTVEDLKLETTRFLLTPQNEEIYYLVNGYIESSIAT